MAGRTRGAGGERGTEIMKEAGVGGGAWGSRGQIGGAARSWRMRNLLILPRRGAEFTHEFVAYLLRSGGGGFA